jgi:hypothetical protein
LQNQSPRGPGTPPSGADRVTKQVPDQPGQLLPGFKGQPLPAAKGVVVPPPSAPSSAITPGTGLSSPTGAAKPGVPSPRVPAAKPVAPAAAPSRGHDLPTPPARVGAKPTTPLQTPAAKLSPAPPSNTTKPATPSAPAGSNAQPPAQNRLQSCRRHLHLGSKPRLRRRPQTLQSLHRRHPKRQQRGWAHPKRRRIPQSPQHLRQLPPQQWSSPPPRPRSHHQLPRLSRRLLLQHAETSCACGRCSKAAGSGGTAERLSAGKNCGGCQRSASLQVGWMSRIAKRPMGVQSRPRSGPVDACLNQPPEDGVIGLPAYG